MAKLPYRLVLISTKDGAVWYARYNDPRTGKRNKFSTYVGADEDKGRALTVAAAKLAEIKEGYGKCPRLEDYAADFFKGGCVSGSDGSTPRATTSGSTKRGRGALTWTTTFSSNSENGDSMN